MGLHALAFPRRISYSELVCVFCWRGEEIDSDDVEDEESVETIRKLRVRELNQAHEEAPAVAGVAILNVADMYS